MSDRTISRFPGLTPTRSRAEWVDPSNPPMRAWIGVELEASHIVEIVVTAAK